MKIALLNDTHFGVRNDSPAFMDYQNDFYNNLFFPYLKEHNIKTLIHLGDVVDRRKFINHKTAHNFGKVFWDKLWEEKIDTHIILGNHDTYYKNTNEVNAIENLYTSFDGKNEPFIYTHTQEVEIDGCNILFIPWICDENYDDSLYAIDNTAATVAMGHLEVKGFEMHKGHINDHGLEKKLFDKFDIVYSGHFHKKSDDGRIYYLGTQYEMTWSDYQCPKGFHIFDTDTRELTRVSNPKTIHEKIYYDDGKEDYNLHDISKYDKKFVKMYIMNKSDDKVYDKFLGRLYNDISMHELQIIEDTTDITTSVSDDLIEKGEDTMTFLRNYIDEIDTDLDKNKLKEFTKECYSEAIE